MQHSENVQSPIPAVLRIPQRVWHRVFDYADWGTLFTATFVCPLLASAAFYHPTFWECVSDSLVDRSWFVSRLERGEHVVRLREGMQPKVYGDLVNHSLPVLLQRLKSLAISVDLQHLESLVCYIDDPAPELEEFSLELAQERLLKPARLIELPQALFKGHAPCLRSVELIDVALPSAAVPAFSRVTDVSLSFRREDVLRATDLPSRLWHDFPRTLFTVFPAVRLLRLCGGRFAYTGIDYKFYARFESLDRLDVVLGDQRDWGAFLENLSTARIPIVDAEENIRLDIGTVHKLVFPVLCDELSLAVTGPPTGQPALTLYEPSTQVRRSFHVHMGRTLFSAVGYILKYLRISASMWGILPGADFPLLDEILVEFDDDITERQRSLAKWPLTCLRLRLVVFLGAPVGRCVPFRCILDVLRSFKYAPQAQFAIRDLDIEGPQGLSEIAAMGSTGQMYITDVMEF